MRVWIAEKPFLLERQWGVDTWVMVFGAADAILTVKFSLS